MRVLILLFIFATSTFAYPPVSNPQGYEADMTDFESVWAEIASAQPEHTTALMAKTTAGTGSGGNLNEDLR
jgi:hypothetical protein